MGQLIPDCFTPISLLALGLLLWAPAPALGRIEWGGLGLLYAFSLSVHTSHLVIHLLLLGWWGLTDWLPRWRRYRRAAKAANRKPLSATG